MSDITYTSGDYYDYKAGIHYKTEHYVRIKGSAGNRYYIEGDKPNEVI